VVRAAKTTFAVSTAQLAQTPLIAGTAGGDDLLVNAYYGAAPSGPTGGTSISRNLRAGMLAFL
jgi:hypothetical protein